MVLLGANVAIIGRRPEVTQKAADEIAQLRPGAKVIGIGGVDVRNIELLKKAVDQTVAEFGRIDYVVAGAAGNFLASFNQLSSRAFKSVIDIDLIGSYNTAKVTAEELKKTKGQYIFISASLHYTGTPFQTHVAAAKAGVDALSNNLAIELGPFGIRSNVICPGPIQGTEGLSRLIPDEAEKNSLKSISLNKFGRTQDIADATIFLFSPAANYISGTTVVVDGAHWRTAGGLGGLYPEAVISANSGVSKL